MADPRHSELFVEQLGLEQSRIVSTAGATNDETTELVGNAIRLFRSVAVRCNCLMDRPNIMFASKEVCLEMSQPKSRELCSTPSGYCQTLNLSGG